MRLRNRDRRKAAPSSGAVHVHIGRLVVEGLAISGSDAARIQSAVERELRHVLASMPATAWSNAARSRAPAAAVHLAPGTSASVWGRQIARTVAASVSLASGSRTRKGS